MPTGGSYQCPSTGLPVTDNQFSVLCGADGVEFLRRYAVPADGTVDVTDTLLDGVTPVVPIEPVGLCDDESPGEPCDQTTPVATTGLCLADSTPIAVTTERDCDGQVIRTGWLDLTTGAFSAGAPPAGTRACGETAAFDVSGAFCDVDPATGDVFAIVLVEIERGPDGDITGTQLINPVDGSPYTLQGELSTCPVGVQQPERDLIVLCDVAADGTVTRFVRDFARDENGQIVGFSDYDLAGTPFAPSGTVEACDQADCRSQTTLLVCDVPVDGVEGSPTATDTDPAPYPNDPDPLRCINPVPGGAAALWAGGSVVFPVTTTGCEPTGQQVILGAAATLQAAQPACDDGTARVSVSVQVTNDGPNTSAINYAGGFRLHRADTGAVLAATPPAVLGGTAPGESRTLSVQATAPASLLAAGQVVVVLDVESFDNVGQANPGTQWTADQFTATYEYGIQGCETQFLRTVTTDCDGNTISVTDTDLDGDPFTPTGEVGECVPATPQPEPCQDCETVVLCDSGDVTDVIPGDGTTTGTLQNGVGWSTDTSTSSIGTPEEGWFLLQGFPPTPQVFTFDQPASVRFQVTSDGPCINLSEGVELVELHPEHTYDPATRQLCPSTQDLGARSTFETTGLTTEIGLLAPATGDAAAYAGAFEVTLQGEVAVFVRQLCYGCAGELLSVVDTGLDGVTGYTPVGEVGVCGPVGTDEPEPCRNTSTLLVCDLPTDGEPDPTATDTDPTQLLDAQTSPGANPVAGGAAALWSGGTLTIPPDTAPAPDGFLQHTRVFAATLQAPQPACDTGTATVTATMRVERNGPDAGCEGTGSFSLNIGSTRLTTVGVPSRNIPVGTVGVLTVTARVPAADLAAGNVAVLGRLETYHLAPGSCPGGSNPDGARIGGWTVDEFAADVVYDQAGCAEQVFANVVTDCETGQVESVTYTTPDGQPYEPTGDIGECQPITPDPCEISDTFTVCKCDDVNDDGTQVASYTEVWAFGCDGGPPTLLYQYQDDPGTPYEPVNPVTCADLAVSGEQMVGVQALRMELSPGDTFDLATEPLAQSVTVTAINGQGEVTDANGTTTLFAGEHATWSVVRDIDLTLSGPLQVAATTGTVTVNITRAVTA